VGYPRAARLIDELEELGVVGPPQAGGRSRDVLVTEEDAEQELPDATEAEGDPDLADEVGDDA